MKYIVVILLVIFPFEIFSQEIEGSFSKEIKTKVQLNYILQLPTNQKEKFPLSKEEIYPPTNIENYFF